MKVRDLFDDKNAVLYTLDQNKTVLDAAQEMIRDGVGAVIIINSKSQPVGIFTERDVLRLVAEKPQILSTILVQDEMSTNLIVALMEDNLEEVSSIMYDKHLRHLPIVEEGKIRGVLSVRDVAKARLEATEFEVHYLRDYVTGKY